jgi:hypothetical protein
MVLRADLTTTELAALFHAFKPLAGNEPTMSHLGSTVGKKIAAVAADCGFATSTELVACSSRRVTEH